MMKYVVILEMDNGYIDCIAVCDKASEAYGEAYLALCDDLDDEQYCITPPAYREGENGFIMELKEKKTGKVEQWATVLFYKQEKEDGR